MNTAAERKRTRHERHENFQARGADIRQTSARVGVLLVRESGGEGIPLILYLESTDPFRGYFLSPALPGETRVSFRDYREFARKARELTEKVRGQFRAGKRPDTEHWRLPPAGRRADRVLFLRPGRDGEWSGDIYTPGKMTLEIFRGLGELEKRLCP